MSTPESNHIYPAPADTAEQVTPNETVAVYDAAITRELFGKLVDDETVAEDLFNGEVAAEPLLERILDAYEILRGETAKAKRDRQVLELYMQGHKPAGIIYKLGRDQFTDRQGNVSHNPRQAVANIRHEFPSFLHRELLYTPDIITLMTRSYMKSGDPRSFVLPPRRTQLPAVSKLSVPNASDDDRDATEHWLTVGLRDTVSDSQRQALGSYLLGELSGNDMTTETIRQFSGAVALVETYTYESNAERYDSEDFRRVLAHRENDGNLLKGFTSESEQENPVYDTLHKIKGGRPAYERAVAERRNAIIAALRRVMVIIS